ncbi:hypothetical protein E6C27_scaffold57G001200 [Cucumis melo var. makuwa]|uniref:Uncharacterized protein n=1 Tax=Cucumis melo var. makuwa TaxID=1194695 RepID=A0A5A7SWZ1_CUCMM|nr:hypothetical protein E6C27_scaffold57G001200 [Cucumis melo var. makuwa]
MTSKLAMAGSTAMILTPPHPPDLLPTVRLFFFPRYKKGKKMQRIKRDEERTSDVVELATPLAAGTVIGNTLKTGDSFLLPFSSSSTFS